MKRNISTLFCFVFLSLISSQTFSQDITGIWRGYFIGSGGEQYKYEVQINQTKGMLTGVTYSYLDTRFYGKAVFTGNFTKSANKALVQETKTVEVKMALGNVSCIMKCKLEYVTSGREEFLEGVFSSYHEKDSYQIKKGTDCGGGTVYLRKVKSTEFYIEPSLKAKIEKKINEAPPLVKNNDTPKPPSTAKPKTITPKDNNNSTAKNNNRPANPEVKKEETVTKKEPELKITPKQVIPIPVDLKNRENNLVKVFTVRSNQVTVKLYDNGEIDDDTISVYLDKKLVLSNKRLTASPLSITIKMDEENKEHELVMVAENLGRIPPNTSLMIVDDGNNRYSVSITSTEQKNAVVRFKYEKKESPQPFP